MAGDKSPIAEITIDPEVKPKSAIAYVMAQAILALGNELLNDYEASRKANRIAAGRKP